MIYTHAQALKRIAALMDSIQADHAEARKLAEEFEIPFEIELEGGRFDNVVAEYQPWSSSDTTWSDSGCSY